MAAGQQDHADCGEIAAGKPGDDCSPVGLLDFVVTPGNGLADPMLINVGRLDMPADSGKWAQASMPIRAGNGQKGGR